MVSVMFRTITVKYAGRCGCCGGEIKRGEIAEYDRKTRTIYHLGGPNGESTACYHEGRKRLEAEGKPAAELSRSKYSRVAEDPVDSAYEDDCARACGLL